MCSCLVLFKLIKTYFVLSIFCSFSSYFIFASFAFLLIFWYLVLNFFGPFSFVSFFLFLSFFIVPSQVQRDEISSMITWLVNLFWEMFSGCSILLRLGVLWCIYWTKMILSINWALHNCLFNCSFVSLLWKPITRSRSIAF